MTEQSAVYYRSTLAQVHHLGFWRHATACAPGVLALLEPIRRAEGLVVELGCGSGLLTRFLVEAGHSVLATDASPAMLELTAEHAPGVADLQQLVLPRDPIPPCDAIVSVGHVLSYLPTEVAIDEALANAARALRPGGLIAFDIADLEWGGARLGEPAHARVGEDWAVIVTYEQPRPDLFVRNITAFVARGDGAWQRDDERHENVLVDSRGLPARLQSLGVDARLTESFGDETLPTGLCVVIGRRRR